MVFGANCPTSGTAPPKPRGGRTRTAATSPGAPVRSDTRLDVDLTEVLVISGAACSSIGRGSGAGIGTFSGLKLRGGAIAIRGAARLTHRVLLERTDGCRSQSARSVEAAARRIARQRRRGQPDRIRPVVGRAFQQEMRVSCFNVDISVPYVAAISRSCVAGETVTSSRHLVDNTARLQRRAWGIFWT
jgi:hypothetical protein